MRIDYTSHLRADGEKMALAVAQDLDAHVPTCPEWNVAKLTIHTGQHHRWVADAVRRGGRTPDQPPKPGLRGSDLVEWFRRGWSELADLLDRMDDDEPAWSWSGDNRVGFWRRRTSLETLVHRWDAQNAVGETSALDRHLATDGIDEMLLVMIRDDDTSYRGSPLTVALTTSDTQRAWTLTLEEGTPIGRTRVEDPSASVTDISVTGSAENLLLFLWGRYDADAVDMVGDEEMVASLMRWMKE